MKPIVIISTLLLLVLLNGCQIIDKPEEVPSFIYVEKFNFQTTSIQGSSSSKITDVWVYIDDNLAGMWELPATIPLHYKGEHNIALYAGIKKNGSSNSRVKYPFYDPYSIDLNLIQDSIITINPTTQYENGLNMWIEDFEDPGLKFFRHSISDTSMIIVSSPTYSNLFEGSAGAIFMDANNYLCEMRTDELSFNNFPKQLDIPAYIEMDYKSNYEFFVGILHKDGSLNAYQSQNLITFYPTNDENDIPQWNKTYIYIPDGTNFYTTATEFDIFVKAFNGNSENDIEIFLDNIKVIFR